MSVKNLIAEVLSAHADRRLKEAKSGHDYARLFPDHEELPSLLFLADQLRNVLKPVEPSRRFRDQLRHDLIMAAREQPAEEKQSVIAQFFSPTRTITLAATMLVTVIIGVVVKRWRRDDADLLQST